MMDIFCWWCGADTTPPVIEMFGDAEVQVTIDSEYVDAGARAFDLYDWDYLFVG